MIFTAFHLLIQARFVDSRLARSQRLVTDRPARKRNEVMRLASIPQQYTDCLILFIVWSWSSAGLTVICLFQSLNTTNIFYLKNEIVNLPVAI
jgi:hypothetical protein